MRLGLGHDGARAHGDARVKHPRRRAIMVLALTEATMLIERGGSAEQLATVLTLDLGAAVSMHALVTAEVGKLSVGFVTHFAWGNKKMQPIRAWLNPF